MTARAKNIEDNSCMQYRCWHIENYVACMIPDEVLSSVPWRHVVLGLCLAELANSTGHPFSVDIPAAHLPQHWPAVLSLWLLKHKGVARMSQVAVANNNDVYPIAQVLSCPIKPHQFLSLAPGTFCILWRICNQLFKGDSWKSWGRERDIEGLPW